MTCRVYNQPHHDLATDKIIVVTRSSIVDVGKDEARECLRPCPAALTSHLSNDNYGHLNLCQERQSLSREKTLCILPSNEEIWQDYLEAQLLQFAHVYYSGLSLAPYTHSFWVRVWVTGTSRAETRMCVCKRHSQHLRKWVWCLRAMSIQTSLSTASKVCAPFSSNSLPILFSFSSTYMFHFQKRWDVL